MPSKLLVVQKVVNTHSSTLVDTKTLVVYLYVDGVFQFKSPPLSLSRMYGTLVSSTPRLSEAGLS